MGCFEVGPIGSGAVNLSGVGVVHRNNNCVRHSNCY